MASIQRAPKQWYLQPIETVNTFENCRQNFKYTLALHPNFAPFLIKGAEWKKLDKRFPLRGFIDDTEPMPENMRKTAVQKVALLELMLGQIANYCGVISRNTILKSCTSIDNIWQKIREYYHFQSTGGHFLDLCDIELKAGERPEPLYQRLMSFVEDNLLSKDGGILHHGETVEEDEEMSPSLENMVVLT